MCNYRNETAKEVRRKKGIGYKLFFREYWGKEDLENLKCLIRKDMPIRHPNPALTFSLSFTPYEKGEDGWVRWRDKSQSTAPLRAFRGEAFCAFSSLKEARRAGREFNGKSLLCKILYEDAIGSQMEENFIRGMTFKTLLVKAWKPLEVVGRF